jgi:hypothetical protein
VRLRKHDLASRLELAVIVAGSVGSEQTFATLENQSHEKWTAGVLDLPPLAIAPDLIAKYPDEIARDAEIVLIAMAGLSLDPNALARVAAAFDDTPEALALLTHLAEPDVGAGGALLTWSGGVVQHGGWFWASISPPRMRSRTG